MASKQMRAFRKPEGAKEAHLQSINIPKVGHGEVLVKIMSAGLVPGVLKIMQRGMTGFDGPMTLGHQGAGTIKEVGPGVDEFQAGQRVRIHPGLSCFRCKYCNSGRDHMCVQSAVIGFQSLGKGPNGQFAKYHDGSLAEYMVVPTYMIDVLPDNVSFDVGAKVQDLANAVRVLRECSLPVGSVVAITAASGTMGTACARLASKFGIRRLILVGRNIDRLRSVEKLASVPCNLVSTSDIKEDDPPLPAAVRAHAPEGVDAIIDFMAEGTETYSIIGALAVNGSFVHMGASSETLPLPLIAMMVNCWKIVGTRSNSREDALWILSWLKDGTLKADDLISHQFKLSDVECVAKSILDRSIDIRMGVFHTE